MAHNHYSEGVGRKDLRSLSYAEFGRLLGILTRNVQAACRRHDIQIDTVAPILRSGGFTGCHLASKLKVMNVLPLQYKHTYDLVRPIDRCYRVPKRVRNPAGGGAVLVADTNTVTGEIARCAVADIRAIWPDSTIVFASVMLDVSLESLPEVDILVSAQRTNERRTLSRRDAGRLGVANEVYIFPWEDIEEQWAEIQSAQSHECS